MSKSTKVVDNIVTHSSVRGTAGEELPAKSSDRQSKESAEGGRLLHPGLVKRITEELGVRFPHSIIEVRQNDGGSVSVYVDRVKVFDMEKTQQLLNHLLEREGNHDEKSRL